MTKSIGPPAMSSPGPIDGPSTSQPSSADIVAAARAEETDTDRLLVKRKLNSYLTHATTSPFPDFHRPTLAECHDKHERLSALHQKDIDAELTGGEMPESFPHVLDALIVGVFSQATSWNNAKRAMASVASIYGSTFAYQQIVQGGSAKFQETIRCGGLHVRKTMMIMSILKEVYERYGKYDLDHLHHVTDDEAMEELLRFKYIGQKTASVVMSWSLKRQPFTVDTHVYRITGLWGWRPEKASKDDAQRHLEAKIPADIRLHLHFLLIHHGRACPACRGGAKPGQKCLLQTS